jgi:hypothetical protein
MELRLSFFESAWVEMKVEVDRLMFMLGLSDWIFIYMMNVGVWTMDMIVFDRLWIFIYMLK